ncbi:MAG: hypothetical protein MUF21_10025 [Gemmatimonadaceae bacterium]|nr:hypothetical protein [Gemmatimonadaceae bacterium]
MTITFGTPAAAAPTLAWPDVLLWMETIDALLRGFGHALNNRALALGATVESLDARRPLGSLATSALSREVQRLTEQLRQLRQLQFARQPDPMPLLLADVVPVAATLHRAHATVGDVSCYVTGAPDTPPVLVAESALVHAVLVTLTGLKLHAGPTGVVRIHHAPGPAGDGREVVLDFVAEREAAAIRAAEPVPAEVLVRPAVIAGVLLGASRPVVTQRVTPLRAEVRWVLPSLREMRRREREAR